MFGLKFTLSDETSLPPDDLSGLKNYIHSDLRQSHEFSKNEQMQMVFATEEFLEVATESWSEWDFNQQPLNFVQTLKPTELSGHYIYI